MNNDQMMAAILYRIEEEERQERIARRLAASEHPGFIRRPSLWERARRLLGRGPISFRGRVEPG